MGGGVGCGDGERVTPRLTRTARGLEATVRVRSGEGASRLVITLR